MHVVASQIARERADQLLGKSYKQSRASCTFNPRVPLCQDPRRSQPMQVKRRRGLARSTRAALGPSASRVSAWRGAWSLGARPESRSIHSLRPRPTSVARVQCNCSSDCPAARRARRARLVRKTRIDAACCRKKPVGAGGPVLIWSLNLLLACWSAGAAGLPPTAARRTARSISDWPIFLRLTLNIMLSHPGVPEFHVKHAEHSSRAPQDPRIPNETVIRGAIRDPDTLGL